MGIVSSLAKRLARAGHGTGAPAYLVRGDDNGARWWLTDGDGNVLATSPQPADTPGQARRDTFVVRLATATGQVECRTDEDGLVRWRLLSPSGGAVLAVSAVGYAGADVVAQAIAAFRHAASHAELRD